MGGDGSGVPFHRHGPVFAEVLHGHKVKGVERGAVLALLWLALALRSRRIHSALARTWVTRWVRARGGGGGGGGGGGAERGRGGGGGLKGGPGHDA